MFSKRRVKFSRLELNELMSVNPGKSANKDIMELSLGFKED